MDHNNHTTYTFCDQELIKKDAPCSPARPVFAKGQGGRLCALQSLMPSGTPKTVIFQFIDFLSKPELLLL
jgi:hypothetical protein